MIDAVVWVVTICSTISALLLAIYLYRQNQGGLPPGDLIYADNEGEDCEVLVSTRYGLKGKPDALVQTKRDIIPVERKRGQAPKSGKPYDGDLMQAMAYCVLVEERYGRAPSYARIQYADRVIDEAYTGKRKAQVLETAQRVRRAREEDDRDRSHNDPNRCRGCGQRLNCDQELR